jgi:WD40 repeat protein
LNQRNALKRLHQVIKENNLDLYDEDQIKFVKFSPDEQYLACGDHNGVIYIYKLDSSFDLHKMIPAHNLEVTSLDFVLHENTYLLASGSQDGLIHIFDLNKNFEFTTISEHEGAVRCVCFAVDKSLVSNNIKFISCGADNNLLFFSVNGPKSIVCYHRVKEDNLITYDLSLNPDQTKLIAGHNGKISIWDVGSAFCEKILEMKSGSVPQDNFRVAIDKTGVYMAISCNDKYVRVRNIINGQLIIKIPCSEYISSLSFSINNEYLIVSSSIELITFS